MSLPIAPSGVTCSACGASWPNGTATCPADGTVLEAAADDEALPPGTSVGEYKIESLLGRGGMGEVYGAHHPVIGKRVAIKVMNRACSMNPTNVERFVHEAKAVNAIGHSNIVDIFSFGRTGDGRCYFVMEWLQGESLRTTLGHGPVDLVRTYDILDAVLRALEAAHAAGIVHRDLKPDNIFLVKSRDERERIKLLDFGIAKLAVDRTGGPRTSITQTGTVVGTPTHMAPEQATGGSVGPASDIYALGVVAFELATGQLPFTAKSSVQLMAKHCDEPPPMPRSIRPIGLAFEHLILDMLSKRPGDRPSASDVRRRLTSLRDAPADSPNAADEQRTLPGARALAKPAAPSGSAPTEVLPATAPSVPVASEPSLPPVRSRSKWPMLGVAGVVVVAAIVVLATRGRDDIPKAAAPSVAPVASPQLPPSVTPVAVPAPVPEPAQAPAPASESGVAAAKAAEPARAINGRKQPARRLPKAAPPSSTLPVEGQSPPSASPPPAPVPAPPKEHSDHDVDAVHDPFSDVGGKK